MSEKGLLVSSGLENQPASNIGRHRTRLAVEFIQNHCTDKEITLSQVAEHVGVTAPYLCRLLATHVGSCFRTLRRQMRLDRASELLANIRLTIKEISWEVGYKDCSSFDRDFKLVFGMRPIEFRSSDKLNRRWISLDLVSKRSAKDLFKDALDSSSRGRRSTAKDSAVKH